MNKYWVRVHKGPDALRPSNRPFVPDVRFIVRNGSVLLLLLLLLLLLSSSSLSSSSLSSSSLSSSSSYAVAVEIGVGGGDEEGSKFRMLPSPLLRHAFCRVTRHDLPYHVQNTCCTLSPHLALRGHLLKFLIYSLRLF